MSIKVKGTLDNNFSFICLLCLAFLINMACKGKDREATKTGLSSEFITFYERFHSDSLYQLDHIIFPLSGKPEMMERDTTSFEWPKNDWIIHKPFDTGNREFIRKLNPIDENLVEELIQHKTTGFGMKRRFALMSNEWMLIYYMGMNPPEYID